MRALVISGGGSKGAFAGGVAQYLIEHKKKEYTLFLGTSTGSLLTTHLALNKIQKLKQIFTSVTQKSIFDNCPFYINKKNGIPTIGIHHFNVLKNFIRGRKTFGESNNLRTLIANQITPEEFYTIKDTDKDIYITVSNLSTNKVEYKSLKSCSYQDYIDWVWISCNYVPFMSLVKKNHCEYADGGLGCIIPIEKAIQLGATEIDAIVLDTEFQMSNRVHAQNAFDSLNTTYGFMGDRLINQNIKIGKLLAEKKEVQINMFYTPTILTTNSLIFNPVKMNEWWQSGWEFAQKNDQNNT